MGLGVGAKEKNRHRRREGRSLKALTKSDCLMCGKVGRVPSEVDFYSLSVHLRNDKGSPTWYVVGRGSFCARCIEAVKHADKN